jgi:Protein of unknown function (DUF1592)/Protein of unknown function (DUF1588)/Protein of unknown function (DUF1595)/Protein of unknown function (DUF1587)
MGLRIAACIGWLSVAAAPLLMGACSSDVTGNHTAGTTGGTTSVGGGGASSVGGSVSTEACTDGLALANARIWRLSDDQYVNAVRQLFGVTAGPHITQVEAVAEFTNLSELSPVSNNTVVSYQTAAKDIARQAVTSHFDKFMACGTSDSCVQQFVRNRVARAFGRRLDDTEVAGYVDVYHQGLTESPQMGVRLMIEATLQSPSFLYRTELGTPTPGGGKGQVSLAPHEIATLLAFSLTNSVPDETLWQKADTGEIADPAVYNQEVERLLELPETKANLTQLAGYWLGIEKLKLTEKDTSKFPEFTPALKADMTLSTQLFVQDLLATGSVTDLVTSSKMFLNESMAAAFGIPGVTGTDMKPVQVAAAERHNGILSQPGVLAAYSRPTRGDPIHRGLFSFYGLACGGQVPAPPATALAVAATFPPDATERELAGLRAANPICLACHARFDPLGLITERFDPIGRYHETDAKGPIDQSSALATLGPDLDGPVDGVAAFTAKLVQGRRLSDCAAQNLTVFTLGRDIVDIRDDKSCALQGVKDSFAKTGKFRDFYKALITNPGFLKRDVK